MFLYILSIKIDDTLAYRSFIQDYSPMTNHEPYHRQWVPHFNLKYNDIKNCQAVIPNRRLYKPSLSSPSSSKRTSQPKPFPWPLKSMSAKGIAINYTAWLSLPVVQAQILNDQGRFQSSVVLLLLKNADFYFTQSIPFRILYSLRCWYMLPWGYI